jgi:hypothetical protein
MIRKVSPIILVSFSLTMLSVGLLTGLRWRAMVSHSPVIYNHVITTDYNGVV